jgi:hypothetical protein
LINEANDASQKLIKETETAVESTINDVQKATKPFIAEMQSAAKDALNNPRVLLGDILGSLGYGQAGEDPVVEATKDAKAKVTEYKDSLKEGVDSWINPEAKESDHGAKKAGKGSSTPKANARSNLLTKAENQRKLSADDASKKVAGQVNPHKPDLTKGADKDAASKASAASKTPENDKPVDKKPTFFQKHAKLFKYGAIATAAIGVTVGGALVYGKYFSETRDPLHLFRKGTGLASRGFDSARDATHQLAEGASSGISGAAGSVKSSFSSLWSKISGPSKEPLAETAVSSST